MTKLLRVYAENMCKFWNIGREVFWC